MNWNFSYKIENYIDINDSLFVNFWQLTLRYWLLNRVLVLLVSDCLFKKC